MKRRVWRLYRIKAVQGGCWIEVINRTAGVVDVIEVFAGWEEIPMVEMAGYFEPWIQHQIEKSFREEQVSDPLF